MSVTQNDWIFSQEFLDNSPSRNDGFSAENEAILRNKTVWFIEDLAQKLEGAERIKRNRKVVSTACVFFHRFYAFHSFQKFKRFQMALACFFLACKVEECPLKLKDVVHAYFVLNRSTAVSETDARELYKNVLLCERILLQTLNFDLNITHPYSICLNKIKELRNYFKDSTVRETVMQTCFNFVNDSYRTPACLLYSTHHIALSAFFLSTIQLSLTPVNSNQRSLGSQTWFDLLEAEIDDFTLKGICSMIATEYKDNDKKLKSDQLLTKINAISPLAITSSSAPSSNVLREGDDAAEYISADTIHEGRKRKMTVTVVKSSTTLAHSEYMNQQQQQKRLLSSSSQSPIFAPQPGPVLSLSVPTNYSSSVASSGGDSVLTTDDADTLFDGDSTPCFPLQGTPHASGAIYQNPLNLSTSLYQSNSTQQQALYSSSSYHNTGTAADTPEFPSLPATPCIEPNATDNSSKKQRMT